MPTMACTSASEGPQVPGLRPLGTTNFPALETQVMMTKDADNVVEKHGTPSYLMGKTSDSGGFFIGKIKTSRFLNEGLDGKTIYKWMQAKSGDFNITIISLAGVYQVLKPIYTAPAI